MISLIKEIFRQREANRAEPVVEQALADWTDSWEDILGEWATQNGVFIFSEDPAYFGLPHEIGAWWCTSGLSGKNTEATRSPSLREACEEYAKVNNLPMPPPKESLINEK